MSNCRRMPIHAVACIVIAVGLIGPFNDIRAAWATDVSAAADQTASGTTEVSVMQVSPKASAAPRSTQPTTVRTGDLAQTGTANPATFIVIAGLGSCLLLAATSETASKNIQ